MIASDFEDALAESLGTVLEEAAFMFGEPCGEPPAFEGEAMTSILSFSGERDGKLYLAASTDTCRSLAVDLMGVEEDEVSDTEVGETLGEILNIVAGVLMQSIFGLETLIQLHPPEVVSGEADAYGSDIGKISMMTDAGERFDFILEM